MYYPVIWRGVRIEEPRGIIKVVVRGLVANPREVSMCGIGQIQVSKAIVLHGALRDPCLLFEMAVAPWMTLVVATRPKN
jgi:hypothetical protein